MVIWAVCLRLNDDPFVFIFVVIVLLKDVFFIFNREGAGSLPMPNLLKCFKYSNNVCKLC